MSADPADGLPPWQWPEDRWRKRIDKVRAGRRLAPSTWPNGARAAVAPSFDYDLHPFVIGYRSRIFIFNELIRYANARGPVWFATHAELANYVVESYAGANPKV